MMPCTADWDSGAEIVLNLDDRLEPNCLDVTARAVDSEVVLIHASSGALFHLNRTGAAVWSLLEGARSVGEIVEEVARAWGRPRDGVRADVERLLGQMIEEGLVAPAADVAAPRSEPCRPGADARPYEPPRLRVHHLNIYDRLEPNDVVLASKVMDGEAIMINVYTGVYYSMEGAGAAIWAMIQAGLSVRQIVEETARLYGVPAERVRDDLEDLSRQLLKENAIRVAGGPPPASWTPPAAPSGPYAAPALNVYRDMEQLLAVDPPMPFVGEVSDPPPAVPRPKELHLGDVDWKPPG